MNIVKYLIMQIIISFVIPNSSPFCMNLTINTENPHTYNKLKLYIITDKYLIYNYISINKNEHNKYLCHICFNAEKSPSKPPDSGNNLQN